MYIVHCTLYIVHLTLCTVHCTLYTIHHTQYIAYGTLYIIHLNCTQYTLQTSSKSTTPYTVQCTLYDVHCTAYIVRDWEYTLPRCLYVLRVIISRLSTTLLSHTRVCVCIPDLVWRPKVACYAITDGVTQSPLRNRHCVIVSPVSTWSHTQAFSCIRATYVLPTYVLCYLRAHTLYIYTV